MTQQGHFAPAANSEMAVKNTNNQLILPNSDKELAVYLNGKSFSQLRFPKLQAIYVQILQDYLDKKISPAILNSLSEEFLQQIITRNKLRTTLCEVLFIAIELNFLSVKFPEELPSLNKEFMEYLQILRAELPFPGKNQKKARQLP